MELKHYFAILKRRWVELVAIAGALFALMLTFFSFQKENFNAKTEIMISNTLPLIQRSVSNIPQLRGREANFFSVRRQLSTAGVYEVGHHILNNTPTQATDIINSKGAVLSLEDLNEIHTGSDMLRELHEDMAKGSVKMDISLEQLKAWASVAPDASNQLQGWATGRHENADLARYMSVAMAWAAKIVDRNLERVSLDAVEVYLNKMIDDMVKSRNALLEDIKKGAPLETWQVFVDTLHKDKSALEAKLLKYREEQEGNSVWLDHYTAMLKEMEVNQSFDFLNAIQLDEKSFLKSLENRLFEADLKMKEKLQHLTPNAPEVERVAAEIDAIQIAITEEKMKLARLAKVKVGEKIVDLQKKISADDEKMKQVQGELDSKIKELTGENEHAEKRREILDLFKQIQDMKDAQNNIKLSKPFQRGVVDVLDDPAGVSKVQSIFKRAWLLGLVIALACAMGMVFIIEYIDNKINTEYDVKRFLNLPVIAVVPKLSKEVLLTEAPIKSKLAEMYNISATLIKSAAQETGKKVFLISSSKPEEGKTTISINVAIAMARKGQQVVLLDTDLHKPFLHNVFGLSNNLGLSTCLQEDLFQSEEFNPEAAKKVISNFMMPVRNFPTLHVISAGPAVPEPVALLESLAMQRFVQVLRDMCEIMIMDSPPIIDVGDTLVLATLADAVILVVGAGDVTHHEASWSKYLLSNVQAQILGVYLNKAKDVKGGKYYYYYSYERKTMREDVW